jgi:hypothetical protein
MVIWVMAGIAFLLFPFCSTSRKRKLCFQRIRERRWIRDTEEEDDWYMQMMRARQARLQPPDGHQPWRISPVQEEEIRKQYLWKLLENYTMVSCLEKRKIQHTIQLSFKDRVLHFQNDSHFAFSTQTLSQTDIHESEKSQSIIEIGSGQDQESNVLPTPGSNNDDGDAGDIESPPVSFPQEYDHDEALKEMDLGESNVFVFVPMPGEQRQTNNSVSDKVEREEENASSTPLRIRQAPNGCAVCLSQFYPKERISWSSNAECSHVFHQDCLLRWFQAVGHKHQEKQLRLCPSVTEEEAIQLCFNFPKLCPCCRRPFCIETEDNKEKVRERIESATDDSSGMIGSESMAADTQSENEIVEESNS